MYEFIVYFWLSRTNGGRVDIDGAEGDREGTPV